MSWTKTSPKQEKLKFIGDWLKNQFCFSDLCKRYGVSRKTGYKLINRYEEEGEFALEEKSHARHHHPNETPKNLKETILDLKFRYPKWGPEKLRHWLLENIPEEKWPATSTMNEILKKHGLVRSRKYRKKVPAYSEPFAECDKPNAVWSADFKGQFKLGNGKYCYPLTISDNFSRFLLLCEGLQKPTLEATLKGFKKAFYAFGLPDTIRTDNGQPFAGVGIGGLTRLSIWWVKLGILPERITPGCPEQNGRHERMHRTLKECTTKPVRENFKTQQECFSQFRTEYNTERPHKALNGKRPSDVYYCSYRVFNGNEAEIIYSDAYEIRKVRRNGEIKWCEKNTLFPNY